MWCLTVSCTLWHQKAAWKAGHKKECVQNKTACVKAKTTCVDSKARLAAAMLEMAGLTEGERQLKARLSKLDKKRDSLGVLCLEPEALALAKRLLEGDPETTGWILNLLGLCHYRTGGFARGCELHAEHLAIWEALGDRAHAAAACGNLGICYFGMGEYAQACTLHEQECALCEALEDRAGFAAACGNLGLCYYRIGDYARARGLHEQARAQFEELGDRAGVARACNGLGSCYDSTGDYVRARELHEQHRAISKALGDRAGVAAACGNLANCHAGMGDYVQARALHEKDRAICEALGDRDGVAGAFGNLGVCCLKTGDYAGAIACFTEKYNIARQLESATHQATAALYLGVAHRLEVRAKVRGLAAGAAAELPGPHACTSASRDAGAAELPGPHACTPAGRDAGAAELRGPHVLTAVYGGAGVQEAESWLQTVLNMGHKIALSHLACLAFDTGDEHKALAHLQDYCSWCAESGRNWCTGCGQQRGSDAPMLTCGGCRVARFCSAEHQRMASRDASRGGCLVLGRHKDVCGLLGMWRQQVLKQGNSPNVLREELLAFLQG